MKNFILLSLLSLITSAYAGSYLDWRMNHIPIKVGRKEVRFRAGFVKANPFKKFRGNILYLQGLGDSILNHDPLFEQLVNEGYRIVAFDYMGQGRSAGTMNDTTIQNISQVSNQVIKLLGRKDGPDGLKYHIIGWSTGGLAAFRKAFFDKGRTILSVTLIAPGIFPNKFVGEISHKFPFIKITKETLTSNLYQTGNDPHEDIIKPDSPIRVPSFSMNLLETASHAQKYWRKIKDEVRGYVLLSGPDDTYVDSKSTEKFIKKYIPHFKYDTYCEALHEIDNEIKPIAVLARKRIVDFIMNKNSNKKNTGLSICN